MEPSVWIDNYAFEVVDNFVYLGSSANTTNNASLEIQRRLPVANRCSYGLNRQLSSKDLSRCAFKTLIIPNIFRRILDHVSRR